MHKQTQKKKIIDENKQNIYENKIKPRPFLSVLANTKSSD